MATRLDPQPLEYTLIEKLTNGSSPVSRQQAAADCMDHMAAGIDTTGDGLCFLMYAISKPENQHFQAKLREELCRHKAAFSADDKERESTQQLIQLPYLDAVIKETLRLAPPIPMSLPRYVPRGGRVIDGYFVPENTIVSCQPYSVHRINEDVFQDPDSFNPERWLEEKGSAERERLFFAFAAGARGCTGRNLAMMEMKICLAEGKFFFFFFFFFHNISKTDLSQYIHAFVPRSPLICMAAWTLMTRSSRHVQRIRRASCCLRRQRRSSS